MHITLLQLWKKLALKKGAQINILRMANDKFLVGVTGVIFNADHQVLLVKHTYRQTPWSLPGGYLQAGEHPKQGLEREIREETNFKVRIEKIIKTIHDEDTARLDMCYIGTFVSGKFKKNSEVIEADFFSRDQLPPLIDDQYEQIELGYTRYKNNHSLPFIKRISQLFTAPSTPKVE